jgi:Fe-Mn family superoxide dismutase
MKEDHMHLGPPYEVKRFDLASLTGISDRTLELHFKLYEGYVKEANRLRERVAEFLADGRVDEEEMPAYSELKRRLGFEYNGMILHEYYFGNLTRTGGGDPDPRTAFRKAVESTFGNYQVWKTDFVSVGKMRGIGWAIAYYDPRTSAVSNHWITLHEVSNITGFVPLLVMDVWEHAFLLDYKPSERGTYIEAFFANVDWRAVDDRFGQAVVERPAVRR